MQGTDRASGNRYTAWVNRSEPVPVAPPGKALQHQSISVRWGDMDALGHVNNTVYFRYFEQARMAWFESTGFADPERGDDGIVIVDAHAEFLRPVIYPATLDVRMAGHSPGRSSFVSTYSLAIGDELYARGHSKIVWIDRTSGRSRPLPSEVRDAIAE